MITILWQEISLAFIPIVPKKKGKGTGTRIRFIHGRDGKEE
jgi:hypothetical protein